MGLSFFMQNSQVFIHKIHILEEISEGTGLDLIG